MKTRYYKTNGVGLYEPDQMRQVQTSLQIREVDPDNLEVEFIISNYSIDSYGTRFDPNGIILDQYRRNPIITYRHMRDGGWFSLPIGRGLVGKDGDPDTLHIDKQGNIRMTVRFTPEEVFPIGYQIYKLVRTGFMNMGSIGADPMREEVITEADGRKTLVFREWALMEFAVCPIGSNDDALVTKRCDELNIKRDELLTREKEVSEAIEADTINTEEQHLRDIVELLRGKKVEKEEPDEPNEDDGTGNDYKVEAETHTTDKGTYVNVKIRREKDGKIYDMVHRDVLEIEETEEQFKYRDYFEKHKDTMKEYREFLDRTYKACGVKKPENELEAVRGLDVLFELASSAPSITRTKSPRRPKAKVTREEFKATVTQLVARSVGNVKAALLRGEPVRNIDLIVDDAIEEAVNSISIP